MRLAYLILAHNNPGQLKRLIGRLNKDDALIFIHVDKKSAEAEAFTHIARQFRNLHFVRRQVSVNWGAFSMVQATLNGLHEILEADNTVDYISLLSGADYPIQKNEMIYDFFLKNRAKEFLYNRPSPSPDLPFGGTDRHEYYYDYDSEVCKNDAFEREMKKMNLKRDFVQGMLPYHGSQWWSLTGKCVRYVLDYVAANKEITNFYRYTKFPDEQFFQTIVMNSPFAANVANENLRYIDWSHLNWSKIDWIRSLPHPKTLTYKEFPKLRKSNKFFARKFDERTDKFVLDLIDRTILQ